MRSFERIILVRGLPSSRLVNRPLPAFLTPFKVLVYNRRKRKSEETNHET